MIFIFLDKDKEIGTEKSNQEGVFLFNNIPSGKYYLIPTYQEGSITFDVSPSKIEFVVERNDF